MMLTTGNKEFLRYSYCIRSAACKVSFCSAR